MASGLITSWEIDGETVETVTDFIFLGSKITADGDCSLPGPSVHGIFQARALEWVAIAFSEKNIYFCFIDYAKAFDCVDHNLNCGKF